MLGFNLIQKGNH